MYVESASLAALPLEYVTLYLFVAVSEREDCEVRKLIAKDATFSDSTYEASFTEGMFLMLAAPRIALYAHLF